MESATAFLDLLGLSYQRNASVPLYDEGKSEVTITVRAGLYFQWKGQSYLVDFSLLSSPILGLLEGQDIKVVVIEPYSPAVKVFGKMAENLGLTLEDSYTVLVSGREPTRNIRLTLPGYFIRDGDNSYLITPLSVPASLADFLARQGVLVLSYGSH
jgi:hypothetical protein